MGASGYARVDQAALAELLQVSQLFDQDLSFEVARLAGCFPAVVRRNMFVEYELGERRVPSGFGLGFPWGLRDRYIATDHWFPRTGVGRAIESALSADPFVSDHAVYLNLLSDDDPDWVEYDIVEGRLDMAPFVFVRPPSRFRTISTREHVRSLCELLPGASPGGEFAGMLDVLVGLGPAGIYRVGLAQQRGQGWWRALITNLRDDQVAMALGSRGATDFEELLELARMLYFERTDTPGACFALSIDVTDGCISAMDVECAYLFRIGDLAVRSSAFGTLLAQLARGGILSAAVADWLSAQCCRDVVATDPRGGMRVKVHHMKYRFLGSPHLRTKTYFHLEMTDHRATESMSS